MDAASASTADVQAELQEYLNSKNINSLFIQIVERLLIDKPDNPVGFIVDYLVKRFPDQVKAPYKPSPAAEASERRGSTRPPSDIKSEDEESDDDDEGDYVDDLLPRGGRQDTHPGRRVSVSAESVDPNASAPELKKVPKSPAESERILDILRDNIMFKHLDTVQATKVMDAMFLVKHQPGDYVIRQGDDGDNFYVIDEGTIDVYMDKGGKETKVKTMGTGESFGELALMYSTPRTATCRAAEDLRLWALDRHSFKVIIMHTTISKRTQHKAFLQRVPILDQLTEYEILTVADALVEERYSDGAVVFAQGDQGHAFYIIKEGVAVCTIVDALGDSLEVARLDSGHYFGEVALMTSKERQATVTAVGQLTLLSLDRKTFKRVMGPLDDILKRNMAAYKKIAAQNI